jgi:hypothetical protein
MGVADMLRSGAMREERGKMVGCSREVWEVEGGREGGEEGEGKGGMEERLEMDGWKRRRRVGHGCRIIEPTTP